MMRKTFTAYAPKNEEEAQEVLRQVLKGGYRALLYSNVGQGASSLRANYVVLGLTGSRSNQDTERLHEVTIEPITESDNGMGEQ